MKKSQTQDTMTTFGGTMRWNKGDLEGGDGRAEGERETSASKQAPHREQRPGVRWEALRGPWEGVRSQWTGPARARSGSVAGSSQGHRASSLSLGVSFPQSVQQAGGR